MIKAATMKAIEDFQTSADFLVEKATIALKVVEDFRSVEFALKKVAIVAKALDDF